MNKELFEELRNFVDSVAKQDNWTGDKLNVWFAKRHIRQWAEDLQKKLKNFESNLDVIP